MEPLHVYPTTKRIQTDTKFLFWFFVIFFGVIGALLVNSMAQSGIEGLGNSSHPLEVMIAIIGGGWFSLYAINLTHRLHRLCKHEGPLLTLTPEGVTDHFYLNRELKWGEIKFVGCRNLKEARNHSREYFILEPVNITWDYRVHSLFIRPMKYHVNYLNIPTEDKAKSSINDTRQKINKYIRDQAPKAYRKKSPYVMPPYVAYLIFFAVVGFWVFRKFGA